MSRPVGSAASPSAASTITAATSRSPRAEASLRYASGSAVLVAERVDLDCLNSALLPPARALGSQFCPGANHWFACPAPFRKIFRFPCHANHHSSPARLVPPKGRIAIVTDAGRDAMDADGAADEQRQGGRGTRVVLTPRRWRQACGDKPEATVTNKPDHRGATVLSRAVIG